MIFAYHKNSDNKVLTVNGELFRHLFLARRHKLYQLIKVSKLDNKLFSYKITKITKKQAELSYVKKELVSHSNKYLHIGWCVVENSIIKNTLASLNQLGVSKISFIKSTRSQNFSLDLTKFNKILINSSQQCGRLDLMELDALDSLDSFLANNPDSVLLNFNAKNINNYNNNITTIIIGAEGGLTSDEVALFTKEKIVSLNCSYILKSENAVLAVAAKILL